MVVSGNVTCAALQQAAASGEVDHDLWGRELTYISGKMPDKLLFQGAPEAAVNFHASFHGCSFTVLMRFGLSASALIAFSNSACRFSAGYGAASSLAIYMTMSRISFCASGRIISLYCLDIGLQDLLPQRCKEFIRRNSFARFCFGYPPGHFGIKFLTGHLFQ